jgi:hypothetical protein
MLALCLAVLQPEEESTEMWPLACMLEHAVLYLFGRGGHNGMQRFCHFAVLFLHVTMMLSVTADRPFLPVPAVAQRQVLICFGG